MLVLSALCATAPGRQSGAMTHTEERPPAAEIVVELRGGVADDLADYARTKIATVLGHAHRPVLRGHVRIVRHHDPARERPVTARVAIDLDGQPINVSTEATTPREAVDLLVDRLGRRLERVSTRWNDRRRPSHHHDRERETLRHRAADATPLSVDDAVTAMQDADQDFRLFVEAGRGVDSVVHRAGPDGVQLVPGTAAVTPSAATPPVLDWFEASAQLLAGGLSFLFYLDADHGRGSVVYVRDELRLELIVLDGGTPRS
jgi:ribosome-associated translation inhibitor RaiA